MKLPSEVRRFHHVLIFSPHAANSAWDLFSSVTFPLKRGRRRDASCSSQSCVSLFHHQLHSNKRSNIEGEADNWKVFLSASSCSEITLFDQNTSVYCDVRPILMAVSWESVKKCKQSCLSWIYTHKIYTCKSDITDQTWEKSPVCCGRRTSLALVLKERSLVWRTRSLFWKQPSGRGSRRTRQEEPVELVCFYSTHREPVFIMYQNMSPYLVSPWVFRGSPPLHQARVWKKK